MMAGDMNAEKMMGYLYELPDQFHSSLELEFDFIEGYRRDYRNIVVTLGGLPLVGYPP